MPFVVPVAVRETIDALTTPPSSSRSYASACATAAPVLSVETLTRPSLIAIPSGSLAGMLRLVDSPPRGLHARHAAERAGDRRGLGARAGACAGRRQRPATAAATATMTAAARSRMRTLSVPDRYFAATCL